MDTLTLLAPLSGRLMPLDKVPDPVFAQKMAGDGIALDPISNALLAPCDGEISQLHPGHHTLTLTTNDIEIMIHIGLDTAPLKGEGFLPHVKAGDLVKSGDTLIEFDPDYVATNATSLLTLILVSNSERIAEFHKAAGDVEAGKNVLMELTPVDYTALAAEGIYQPILSELITVPNPSGLHFRPAAVLSSLARGFKSDIRLNRGDEEANAKSVSSIMGLNIGHQDNLRLSASGPDAYEAINILTPAMINGLGEEGATPIQAPASTNLPAIAAPIPRPAPEDPNSISGIMLSPGLAIGHVYQLRPTPQETDEYAADPRLERRRLDQALAQSKLHLEALRARLRAESNPGQAALFAAQVELMDDAELLDMAYGAIYRGKSATFAWRAATHAQAARLQKLDNELLVGRAADLHEVGTRVANELATPALEEPPLPVGSILIAEDISAAALTNLDRAKVQGIATVLGGPISAAARVARSLNIPAAGGIEARALDIPNGTSIIIDGSAASLHLNPSAEDVAAVNSRLQERETQRRANLELAYKSAVTIDGEQILVYAAISRLEEAREAMTGGCDGIGLLRTEHLFSDRRTVPSEDSQTAEYARIAMTLPVQKPLTIRTLDITSRIPLPFLPLAPEPNPALGLRGIRSTFDQPQILRKQSRAALRASVDSGRKLQLLLPMIATLDHWRTAKELIIAEQGKLEIDPIPIGLLVQVPATAVLAEQFAREVDFFTVDTDDLAQYSLAMDHSNPQLAAQLDPLNPALLKLIDTALQGARAHNKPLAISGVLANDPLAIPILIGLGAKELSVVATAVPNIKSQIRALNMAVCRELAQKALSLATAVEVRGIVKGSRNN